MKVVLKNVRVAFPSLFEPDSIDGGDERYGAKFIFEPKSPNTKLVRDAMNAVALEKWEKKGAATLAALKKKDKLCLKEEPYANKDGEPYDGFDGAFWVSTSNEAMPSIKDRNNAQLTAKSGKPYAGCYVNIVVDIWAQDNKFGQRINAKLLGVQFVKDGDAFGGGARFSDDDFDDLGVDEEGEEAVEEVDENEFA